jgi:phosphatidylglycerophosphate synthase
LKYPQKYLLGEIRAQCYNYHKNYDFSGYTGFKLKLYLESASILTYLLQYRVNPNIITLIYALLGVIGGIFLAIPNKIMILSALIIFYFKGILDSVDGHLARISGTSELGKKLDIWAGTIGTIAFYAGLGFYLGHRINYYIVPYILCLVFVLRKWLNIEMGRARVIDLIIFLVGVNSFILDKFFFIV